MKNTLIRSGLLGVALGFALSAYGHTADGFSTGPLVVLGLATSIAGTVIAGLLISIGKRPTAVWAVASFSACMLGTLVLVPLIWPYSASTAPIPLAPRSERRGGVLWLVTDICPLWRGPKPV